jgi:RNA polymerase sigma-70 factor (ECF subfamily)
MPAAMAHSSQPQGKPDHSEGDLAERTLATFREWRGGDDGAAARLFELHEAWLIELVERELGPKLRGRVEPADVVQEIGVKLLAYVPKEEDGPLERFRALCRQIARHVVTDLHRHHFTAGKRGGGGDRRLVSDSQMGGDLPRASVTTPSRAFERLEEKSLVRLAVYFLEPERRDLLGLRWWLDVPFADLAERFGADEATLRMRHMRATIALGPLVAKVSGALARLEPADRDLILLRAEGDLTFAALASLLKTTPVRACSSFQQAMRRLARAIDEPFHPLGDGWPWSLAGADGEPPASPG